MKVVKATPTTLSSPFSASDTSFRLSAFVDSQGTPIVLASFGTWFAVVIKSGATTEIIKCDGITQNDDGTATLTVASSGRDILPISPFTGGAVGEDFPAGADVIITNDPLSMSTFANVEEDTTFLEAVVFTEVPSSLADPVADNDLTRKSYVAALVLGTLTTIDVIVPGTAGATIAAGNLIYFKDATNLWELCDADDPTTVQNVLLGIAQGAGTSGNPIASGVLLQGVDTHQSALTDGQTMYASNTAGGISNSAGTTTVVVGISKGTTQLYFDPRFNQQVTQNQLDAMAGSSGIPSSSNKFVTTDDVSALAGAGKIVRASGSMLPALDGSALLNMNFFGGTGADGALTITSGVTTIDCVNAAVLVKNYTSISITGTGALGFSNPHTNGTIVILKSFGNVTLTSSATPMIDMRLMGAQASGNNGATNVLPFVCSGGGAGADNSTSTGGAGGTPVAGLNSNSPTTVVTAAAQMGIYMLACGGAGGIGGAGSGTGGAGGRGGGALLIECRGALNFTTANGINVSGEAGTNGTAATQGAGAGGGGSGGTCLIVYNTLTSASGTIVVSGGTGGTGSTGGSGSAGTGGAGGNGSSGAGTGGTGGKGGDTSGGTGGGGGGAGGSYLFGTTVGSVGVAGSDTGAANQAPGGGGGGGASGFAAVVANKNRI